MMRMPRRSDNLRSSYGRRGRVAMPSEVELSNISCLLAKIRLMNLVI